MLIWWSNDWLIFRLKLAMQITGYRATCISMLFAFVLNAWTVIIQTNKNDNHHLDIGSYLFNHSIVVFFIVHCSMMVFPAVSIKKLPVLKNGKEPDLLKIRPLTWIGFHLVTFEIIRIFSGRCLSTKTTKTYTMRRIFHSMRRILCIMCRW